MVDEGKHKFDQAHQDLQIIPCVRAYAAGVDAVSSAYKLTFARTGCRAKEQRPCY